MDLRNSLKFVQVFALGAWVGSIFYFSAAVAPGAFRVLGNPDQAGALVGFTLARLHLMGVIAGALFLVAGLGLTKAAKDLLRPELIGVVLMLAMTVFSQEYVIRRMETLRLQMGPVATAPFSEPRRREFDRLHGLSVELEGGVMLIGLAALFLTVRWHGKEATLRET